VDLNLGGRTAIVCGASAGLGLACAESLAEEGANVVMFARREEDLKNHAARIGGLAVPGDVTLEADLERLVETALDAFGGIDVVVWNGGGPPPGPAAAVTDETLTSAYELVLLPAIRLVGLCLPHLEKSGGGRVIAITSATVKEPTPSLALSNALRPGLVGWLKTLSREVGPQGITVNCVAPGRIDTARLAELYPAGPSEQDLAQIPIGRWGLPRELGDVVCFLASERAAYVTGATIAVDGGLSRGLL
jgi:3-oxoacyl-[acyl-carrier protein] reductase